IATLKGHIDFSFACCWSPDGNIIATGNQDKTTRLYDTRNMSKTLNVLGAKMGAVRSLHFSEDGRYLAMAEPADFVHIFDAHTFERSQVIDLFGEIAGVSFTPDADGLYIANADENYGCILEYERILPQNHIGNIFPYPSTL
ncbi:11558_t:CDS:2, partial [Acaulospora morrowiae]